MHGWPTRLMIAETATESELRRMRREAELLWLAKLGDGKRRQSKLVRPPATLRRAAAKGAEADAVSWLAARPELIERGRDLGKGLNERVRAGLRDHVGRIPGQRLTSDQVDRGTPGHFWCTLLAELSGTGETVGSLSEKVPERAKEQLREEEAPPGWGETQEILAEHGIGLVWTCMRTALGGDLFNIVRVARVMSLFICPDPAGHPALAGRALVPLVGEALTEDIATRLRQAYLIGPDLA